MPVAETDNPCDRNGAALRCERCELRARFRRTIPYKYRRDLPGCVWKMGLDGTPVFPRRRQTEEHLCEHCYQNWPYGVNPVIGSELGRVVMIQLARGDMFLPHLAMVLGAPAKRVRDVLLDLELEGCVTRIGALFSLGPGRSSAAIQERMEDKSVNTKQLAQRAMEIDDVREHPPCTHGA